MEFASVPPLSSCSCCEHSILQNANVAMTFAISYVRGVERVHSEIKERFRALIPWSGNTNVWRTLAINQYQMVSEAVAYRMVDLITIIQPKASFWDSNMSERARPQRKARS